ncbi:hypothetical protein KKE18_03225 [Patescibacteria group bacterium]|nr:hypothetical protein [Patescibacteria group bacterium]MBU1844678.1 hypothetical protein [Patescibacteria group bacterium]
MAEPVPPAVVLKDHLPTAPLPMMFGTTHTTLVIVPTALSMRIATLIAATVRGSVSDLLYFFPYSSDYAIRFSKSPGSCFLKAVEINLIKV